MATRTGAFIGLGFLVEIDEELWDADYSRTEMACGRTVATEKASQTAAAEPPPGSILRLVKQEHGIAVTEKAILLRNGFCIGVKYHLLTGKSTDQHQQGGFG